MCMLTILMVFLASWFNGPILYAWGPTTHTDISRHALNYHVDGKNVLENIANHSDDPDCCHEPKCPDRVCGCSAVDSNPSDKQVLCSYDHGISQFMTAEECQRFPCGGVEKAVICFVQKACEAKARNDARWETYFGWACHFMADALCPPHCSRSSWWEEFERSGMFESYFFMLDLIEWKSYVSHAEGYDYPIFRTLVDIEEWVVNEAIKLADYEDANRQFWSRFPPFLSKKKLQEIFSTIGNGIRGLYYYIKYRCSSATPVCPCVPCAVSAVTAVTATVLVMDVSGSMSWQWRGGVKIESAKKAALQFIEQVANEPRPAGTAHLIGVVTFSDSAHLACPLTADYAQAKQTVIGLGTLASTNLGAGLDKALDELEKVPAGQRFIILLSDGMTNTGKPRDQILATSVAKARAKRICIHTVGFGDPGDIDEDFLKKIAQQSGCGTYNYASSGFELFGTYIKVRHAMLGSNRIVEFKSGDFPVRLLPGQTATLGAFQLTAPAQELHFTLAWSEPGRMQAILVDPSNVRVTSSYPGVKIYSGNGFVHITVFSPKSGIWRASAAASTSFISGVQYYGIVSARTGGIVIPYALPITPCFNVLGTEICVPIPDLPTFLIVIGSVAILAWVVYTRLTSP